jgi:hypothetical protein
MLKSHESESRINAYLREFINLMTYWSIRVKPIGVCKESFRWQVVVRLMMANIWMHIAASCNWHLVVWKQVFLILVPKKVA